MGLVSTSRRGHACPDQLGQAPKNVVPMKPMAPSKGTAAGALLVLVVLLLAGASAWAQAPKAERPTYAIGDKWIRCDGAYDLIRIENGRYVFAADGGR